MGKSKKEIAIIYNGFNRSIGYGISTYLYELREVIIKADLFLNCYFVMLKDNGDEVAVHEKDGYTEILVPFKQIHSRSLEYYHRSIPHILYEYIFPKKNVQLIFHLQSMELGSLIDPLRKIYACKIVLTVHYMQWCMELLGNNNLINKILRKKKSSLTPFEQYVRGEFYREKKTIIKSDHLIFISEHSYKKSHTLYKKINSQSSLIYNSLSDKYKTLNQEEKNKLRQQYYIDTNTCIILFVGRIEELKGIYQLLDAYKSILDAYTNTHLFIIGDGDYNKCINETSLISSKVSLVGYLEKDKLFDFYNIADIGVVPSFYEEFGYVALEMMMHNMPIIVNDVGGLSELIEDGFSGMKYSDKNIRDASILGELIKIYINNPDLAQRLGKNAREVFLQKYESKNFKEKMLDFYEKL